MESHKIIILFLLSANLLYACSSDNEAETNTGKINTVTNEIGNEAVRMIKTPVDKAKAVAENEEKRAQDLDQQGNQ